MAAINPYISQSGFADEERDIKKGEEINKGSENFTK